MTIVSLSFPDQMIRDMDQIQKSRGFTGRSELVRAAIRLMLEDTKAKDALVGNIGAVLTVTHRQDNEEPITRLKHAFQDIVKTHIHSKTNQGNCVELFLLEGDGKKVASMTKAFQNEEYMKSVKVVVL
ncbi:MAG TPA: CopG family ribbon-helix-helix protein [Candidatus Saccharimonadales bacterium]|nr:CopG family ribbon-helix-helix protein [Candidatus Saccharimonadales bacterium]